MITTVVLYIVFAFMDMFDAMLSGLVFIKSATTVFSSLILFVDAIVYYVRSLLPLTISGIFNVMFQFISVYIVIWYIRLLMSTIIFFKHRD